MPIVRSPRDLPSVERLAADPRLADLALTVGRATLIAGIRDTLSAARIALSQGEPAPDLVEDVAARLLPIASPGLRPVINATGVIIHTNLGRAPLAASAIAAMQAVAAGYSTLEYDIDQGRRGSRDRYVEDLLCRITGAEAAVAVNNNAAALLLCLSALSAGREAIISRGQAVEIGGGFRIPDVMRQSGARLVEVGTTNRTYLRDYADAITPDTALMLRVHSSNFRVIGFTTEPGIGDLARLADERGVTLLDDVGSGCLLDVRPYGLTAEPLVQESVAAGAGLVCFSGDKLIGGPQAGLIVGRRTLVDRIRRHPLMRAVRIDKLTLAALIATLRHYARGDATDSIPVWRMISATPASIAARAETIATALGATTRPGQSAIGGGSLPGETLPTTLVVLDSPDGADALAARLRRCDPPIIARIEDDQLVIDPRTVASDDDELIRMLRRSLP